MISELALKIADTLLVNGDVVNITGTERRERLAAIVESAGNLRNLEGQAKNLRQMAMMYGNDVESKISDLETERQMILDHGEIGEEDCRDIDDRLDHWRATRRRILELAGEG